MQSDRYNMSSLRFIPVCMQNFNLWVHCLRRLINSLGPIVHLCIVRLSFMMSLPAMSFGDRFCVSRKAGQGKVGGAPTGCKWPGHVWAQL